MGLPAFPTSHKFLFSTTSMLILAGVRDALRCSAIWPEVEKLHSEAVDDAGTHRRRFTNLLSLGYFFPFTVHHNSGLLFMGASPSCK